MPKLSPAEIQRRADNIVDETLSDIIRDQGLELIPHDQNTQTDRGIDYIFEIVHRKSRDTTSRFNVQVKGTQNLKILKTKRKGEISLQLKRLKLATYYCEQLFEPLIIAFVDINDRRVFWHAIQLDPTILQGVEKQKRKRKRSIQIYFDVKNKLESSTLEAFVQDIRKSRTEQQIRSRRNPYDIENYLKFSSEQIDTSKHIFFQLEEARKKLNGIQSFPTHIFPSLYPFSLNEQERAYYRNFSLYTPNSELVSFLKSLTLKKGILQTSDSNLTGEKNFPERVKNIIKWFSHNLIHHVVDSNERGKKICLHKLVKNENCSCITCSHFRGEFNLSFTLSKKRLSYKDPTKTLKQIFTYVQFGMLKKAYQAYEKAYNKFQKQNQYYWAFLCRYNQKSLRSYIANKYFEKDREKLLDKIQAISLEDEMLRIRDHLQPQAFKSLLYIKDNRYFNAMLWKLDGILFDSQHKYSSDQRGGWSTANKEWETITAIAELAVFMSGNFLITINYNEFTRILHKAFEIILAQYSLKNPNSKKSKSINPYILNLLIHYGDSDKLKKIVYKYDKKDIVITTPEHGTLYSLNLYLKKYLASVACLTKLIDQENSDVYFLRDKAKHFLENLIILTGVIKTSKLEVNNFCQNLIKIYSKNNRMIEFCYSEIRYLLRNKITLLNKRTLLAFLKLSNENNRFKKLAPIILPHLINKVTNPKKFIESKIETNDIESWESVIYNIDLVEKKNRKFIKSRIIAILQEKFSPQLYYMAAVMDLISHKRYLKKYLRSVPSWKENKAPASFGFHVSQRNERITQFLDLAFYLDLDLTDPQFAHIPNGNPYYEWLFNLNSFDYSQFDAHWLLEFQTENFFKAYGKTPRLKEVLKESISRNPSIGIAKIYSQIF